MKKILVILVLNSDKNVDTLSFFDELMKKFKNVKGLKSGAKMKQYY